MSVCLHHVEQSYAIDFSSLISSLYVVKKGGRKKLTMSWTFLFMANTMVQVATLYCIAFVSYSCFCKIFLLLLRYRAVTPKVVGIQGRNLAFG